MLSLPHLELIGQAVLVCRLKNALMAVVTAGREIQAHRSPKKTNRPRPIPRPAAYTEAGGGRGGVKVGETVGPGIVGEAGVQLGDAEDGIMLVLMVDKGMKIAGEFRGGSRVVVDTTATTFVTKLMPDRKKLRFEVLLFGSELDRDLSTATVWRTKVWSMALVIFSPKQLFVTD